MAKRLFTPEKKDKALTPNSKKARFSTQFQNSWISEFGTLIKRSSKSDSHAFCTVCSCDFSIGHSGVYDIKTHFRSEKHKKNEKSCTSTPKMSAIFKETGDPVINAEVLFSNWIVENNIPFRAADSFTDIVKKMFPKSETAQKFSSKRTKTTMIVKGALAPHFDDVVTDLCKREKFSIMIDESNDKGDEKCVCILVRVLNREAKKISTYFLDMPICNIGTAENIFNTVDKVLRARNISWENCIGYASDNASVMIGRHNSVLSRIREQNPYVYNVGCVCHLANICCSHAIKKIPMPVSDLLVDIYFHFYHSSKRKEIYKEYMEFTDTEPLKIIKHCSTRWLSLENCVKRVLHHWDALKSYFSSIDESEKPSREKRVQEYLSDHEMKLYFLFLSYVLPLLNEFNTAFQTDEIMIGYLHAEMLRLLRKFLVKFLSVSYVSSSEDISQIEVNNPEYHHADEFMAVGMEARRYLGTNTDDIAPAKLKRFFQSCRDFYITVTSQMMKKFPFNDPVLLGMNFVNPDQRHLISPEHVLKMADRLNVISDLDKLNDEISDYIVTEKNSLPQLEKKRKNDKDGDKNENDEELEEPTLDEYWLAVEALQLPRGDKRFPLLSRIALTCLSIPHSNAETERSFSVLRKIDTDQRGRLDNSTTCALMSTKLNNKVKSWEFKPNKDILTAAKSSTYLYNTKISQNTPKKLI